VTFELTILFGGVSAAIGMLALNGLPMPYHPVFNVPEFAKASTASFPGRVFRAIRNMTLPAPRVPERPRPARHLGGTELGHDERAQIFCQSVLALIFLTTACRIDMHIQPTTVSREEHFFADGRSARNPVDGTWRAAIYAKTAICTPGKSAATRASTCHFRLRRTLLTRGQDRFNVYCLSLS